MPLLHALIASHSVVMIDEPEAFLHPPQARLLGALLAKESPKNRQLFIATHSGDFLRGVLDTSKTNIRVVRLSRRNGTSAVRELKSEEVKKLWSDPLLRYSNALDGVFHEKVIVCESDADCRFYGALVDAICESRPASPKPDIMFIHCGGKTRIASVVKALRALGVTTIAIADFDVLQDENPIQPIVESVGGKWDEVEKDWRLVKDAIEAKKPEKSGIEIKEEIITAMKDASREPLPKATQQKIKALLKSGSTWSNAKAGGKSFVPSGDPTKALDRLLGVLEGLGLFVVEQGELECFAKSVGGHGPSWVNDVLEQKNLVTDPELDAARKFVEKIINFQPV